MSDIEWSSGDENCCPRLGFPAVFAYIDVILDIGVITAFFLFVFATAVYMFARSRKGECECMTAKLMAHMEGVSELEAYKKLRDEIKDGEWVSYKKVRDEVKDGFVYFFLGGLLVGYCVAQAVKDIKLLTFI